MDNALDRETAAIANFTVGDCYGITVAEAEMAISADLTVWDVCNVNRERDNASSGLWLTISNLRQLY